MKKKTLFALWGGLFSLCAALGFIPEPTGVPAALLTLLSLCFFVPPAVLLRRASRQKDPDTLRLIRNLSALSLGLTMTLLVLNILSVVAAESLGTFLYLLLVIISSPMICSGYWVLSLFLWACLLMVSLQQLRKK